ncbi:MAG: ABC transporter substrate-binding protein [Chloroflexi bacterium]|nr:ABC transporter substrate-binding protein [Chloroflexota bacterium]
MVQAAVTASAAAATKPPSATEISAMVQAALAAATGEAATPAEIEALIAKAVEDSSQAALVAAGEALAAAQAVPEPAMPAPVVGAAGQRYGGTIKIGVVDFGTMDPALMGLSEGSSYYSELAYGNAIVTAFDGALTPWAIESWSANADASQYTFKVRQGISFHSGKALKAEDVKFTFDRILDEATASPLQSVISFISSISTPDDYTVVFDLDGPNAFLPGLLTDYHSRILPIDITSEEITTGEHGAGAFILGEHNPAERTVLERNPNYWRAGAPYVDQIILFYMPEVTTRVEAIKSGAIDVVFDPGFGALDTLSENPNVIVKEAPSAGVRVLDFHTDREPFNNKNLRKAFQYAVDRDFVREAVLFGHGSNANDHPVGLGDEYYWDEQPIIKQDIPRAKEFLTMAGYPDGFDVVLHTADFGEKLDMALAFKESVAAAGIRVEVSNDDPTTYWEEFWMNPCCPFVASSWGARPANQALGVQLSSNTVWNESYYENLRLDELLELANSEPDFVTRKEYFREIQEMLIEDVPVLYLMYTPVIVTHRNRVMDVQAHPGLSETFIENWWLAK